MRAAIQVLPSIILVGYRSSRRTSARAFGPLLQGIGGSDPQHACRNQRPCRTSYRPCRGPCHGKNARSHGRARRWASPRANSPRAPRTRPIGLDGGSSFHALGRGGAAELARRGPRRPRPRATRASTPDGRLTCQILCVMYQASGSEEAPLAGSPGISPHEHDAPQSMFRQARSRHRAALAEGLQLREQLERLERRDAMDVDRGEPGSERSGIAGSSA